MWPFSALRLQRQLADLSQAVASSATTSGASIEGNRTDAKSPEMPGIDLRTLRIFQFPAG
jgi:hypothetical protein